MFFTRMQMWNVHMMQMSHARVQMQSLSMMVPVRIFKPWCKCLLTEMEMQMSSNEYVMMQMSFCRNVMMQMFKPIHKLFKNSLYFQNEISLALEIQNVFKTWFLIEKSSSFWLKALKKLVIIVSNLCMGHWLGIWWFGSKDLFSQKGWHVFKAFFWKTNSLKIKHLKEIHFF